MRTLALITGISIFVSSTVLAQPVYKSVDKDGNVTYSSTPPEEAKHVEDTGIVSRPTPEAGADDDIERIKRTADELEQDRKARETTREKQKAAAEAEEKAKQPVKKTEIKRHRPIIQQPIPPTGSKPDRPPPVPPPAVIPPPSPSPPIAVPHGGGGN
jgi:hypothetical protein